MIDRAIRCRRTVLPARGRRNDQATLALANRRDDIDDAAHQLLAALSLARAGVRVKGVRSSKFVTPAVSSRDAPVHQFNLHEGKVILALDRQTDRPFDDQTRLQAHAANLARRDINVRGAREIAVSL